MTVEAADRDPGESRLYGSFLMQRWGLCPGGRAPWYSLASPGIPSHNSTARGKRSAPREKGSSGLLVNLWLLMLTELLEYQVGGSDLQPFLSNRLRRRFRRFLQILMKLFELTHEHTQ
jgi:hypothetical protein